MELQQAWQGNLFAPTGDPQGPEQYDMGSLKTSYLQMKELLKDNRCPIAGQRLMHDFPKTQLDMYTYVEGMETSPEARLARLLPENSAERKYAVLDSILQYHKGEVRAWGGDWELRQGPLAAPSWAKKAPWNELLALEARTNPLGTASYVPKTYTEQEVMEQIREGKRPDMNMITGFFWAPGMAVAHGTDQTHLVRRVQSWDLPSMITVLGQSWTFCGDQTGKERHRGRSPSEEGCGIEGISTEDCGDQVFSVQRGTPLSPDPAGGALALQANCIARVMSVCCSCLCVSLTFSILFGNTHTHIYIYIYIYIYSHKYIHIYIYDVPMKIPLDIVVIFNSKVLNHGFL